MPALMKRKKKILVWNHKVKLNRGVSFLETLIALALLAIFSAGIYRAFQTVLIVTEQARETTLVTGLLNERAEFIRNLAYSSVGVIGGVPGGVLSPQETFQRNGETFTVNNTVRNIDDPFDGTVTSTPADSAPADYKLIELSAVCTTCKSRMTVIRTLKAAPKNLETSTNNGSLFVNAIDSSGFPVTGANITIINNQASPTISIVDITNAYGVLQIVDTPTGTAAYQITVTKAGYSSAQTYAPGLPENPNPKKPHANVDSGQLTNPFFQIDKISTLSINSLDASCKPYPNVGFSLTGSKLIGTNPDVLKYSATSTTNASGINNVPLEWDNPYYLALNDQRYYIAGMIPYGSSIKIDPDTSTTRSFILASANPGAVLMTVIDASTSAPLADATIHIIGGAVNRSALTGQASWVDTNWSQGSYSSADGLVEAELNPGSLTIHQDPDGNYATSTSHWLISNTIDFGATNTAATAVDWWPLYQPTSTDIKFQLSANNDNVTWDFFGPNGLPDTYYVATTSLSGAQFTNKRYLRYKIFLTTQDETQTPQADWVKINWQGGCVPVNQVLFSELPTDTYTITVDRQNYPQYQTTSTVNQSWQEIIAPL